MKPAPESCCLVICLVILTSAHKLYNFDGITVGELHFAEIGAADDFTVEFDGDAGNVKTLLRQ